jgi:hypothetical protein
LIRVKPSGKDEFYIGRTYDDFKRMHKRLRLELPGKILPPLPRQSSSDNIVTYNEDSDADSFMSSPSLPPSGSSEEVNKPEPVSYINSSSSSNNNNNNKGGFRSYLQPFSGGNDGRHRRSRSVVSEKNPRASGESPKSVVLYRETSRVSLRAALRTLLHNERIAQSSTIREFLTHDPITVNEEELVDIGRRQELDERRIKDQRQFYEVARARAAELDVHMEKFRREVVEDSKRNRTQSDYLPSDKPNLFSTRRRIDASVSGDKGKEDT